MLEYNTRKVSWASGVSKPDAQLKIVVKGRRCVNILISRCLLGEPCRYDGKCSYSPVCEKIRAEGHILIPVCPETEGGLPTPRPPAELQPDGRVINRAGENVTDQYKKGARLALKKAEDYSCTIAVLKARSPSCGCLKVYDGSFSKTLIEGKGVTARLLTEAGICVVDEEHVSSVLNNH